MSNSESSKSPWNTLSTQIVHENIWFRVRNERVIRPDGSDGEFFIVDKNPVVFIVALSEKNEIYLINLFRYTTKEQSWEIPAGAIDEGETAIEAAKRELAEETGLTAAKWEKVGETMYASGISSAVCQIFIAQDLSQSGIHQQQAEGIVNMKAIDFEHVLEMIKNTEIINDHSITAIMLVALKLGLLTMSSSKTAGEQ